MIAIIAEKPSVGQDIARLVGAKEKHTGYLQGNGYIVTWALGHLVGLALPEHYGHKRGMGDLPILPDPFQLTVRQKKKDRHYVNDPAAMRQLNIIDKVLNQSSSVIAATDAGREGELIFRYIYTHTACQLPVKRLWISSLTDEAIYEGIRTLREGSHYDNLYHAAECRAKADWLIGMNASGALIRVIGSSNNSLGRVQTPTLAMICSRFLENRNFHPMSYWHIHVTLEKDGAFQQFRYEKDIRDKANADKMCDIIKSASAATIAKVETKDVQQAQPLLYDLTSLQKDCNVIYEMTAERTLETAQSLYEKKLISYPRTGSRYISPDILPQISSLLRMILRMEQFAHFTDSIDVLKTSRRCINAEKVTDHHALLITGNYANGLSEEQSWVYHLIAGRMLEAFAPKCEKEATLVEAHLAGEPFRSRSSVTVVPGWRGVYNRPDTEQEDEALQTDIARFVEGEQVAVGGCGQSKKKTKPRPLFTEATLLGAMEVAGKDIADEQARLAMRDCGLGTSATRAATITTLLERNYIARSGRSLIPTENGLNIYHAVKNMRIADAELTGSWEKSLAKIERGEMSPETFMESINIFTRQITTEALAISIPKEEANLPKCPKCKCGSVRVYHKVAKCDSQECGFILYRKFLNKELTDNQVSQLLSTGKTKLIKGFNGKRNNTFDAWLTFDEHFNTIFLFPNDKGVKDKPKPKKSAAKVSATKKSAVKIRAPKKKSEPKDEVS